MKNPHKIQHAGREVLFSESALNSGAVPLMAEAWNSITSDGFGNGAAFPDAASAAFWVPEKGVITIRAHEQSGEAWVGLAYVRAEHRKSGVFQLLWHCAKEYGRLKGCSTLAWGVKPVNSRMRRLSDFAGKLSGLLYEFPLT